MDSWNLPVHSAIKDSQTLEIDGWYLIVADDYFLKFDENARKSMMDYWTTHEKEMLECKTSFAKVINCHIKIKDPGVIDVLLF